MIMNIIISHILDILNILKMEPNRFVAFWQTKRQWQAHKKNLANIHSVMNTTNNFSPSKNRNKIINQQIYNHRSFQVQMQNRALLQKITRKESQHKFNTNCEKGPPVCSNKNKKVKYFQDYEKQNQNRNLLQKLKNIRTSYNSNKLAKEYKQKQNYMNLICKFPVRGLKPTKTLLKLQLLSQRHETNQSYAPICADNSHPKSSRVNSIAKSRTKQKITTRNYFYDSNDQDDIYDGKNSKNSGDGHNKSKIARQKIVRFLKIQKLMIEGKFIVAKAIQYQSYYQIKLTMNDNIKEMLISCEDFESCFDSSLKKFCQAIKFDGQSNKIYLE